MMKRKMLLSFCLGLFLTNSFVVNEAKADVEQRRAELIKVLDEELREVSPLLGSRSGLSTAEDSMETVAIKLSELVSL